MSLQYSNSVTELLLWGGKHATICIFPKITVLFVFRYSATTDVYTSLPMCAWPPLGAAPGARIAERSLEAMVISWTGGPYWRAAGGFRVCTPQVHLPWVDPLDDRRRTVRGRPPERERPRTQFRSHGNFLEWWALLARCRPLLDAHRTSGLSALRLARPITHLQLALASPVRITGQNTTRTPLVLRNIRGCTLWG